MALTTKEKVIMVMGQGEVMSGSDELIEWIIDAVEAHIKTRTGRDVFGSSAIAAYGTITMAGIAVADEAFVIDSQMFTWKALRSGVGEVTVGVDAPAAVTNLVTAITADLATVTANDAAGDTVVIKAVTPGTAGNSIIFTEASTNMTMDGSGTLGGTQAGTSDDITEYHNGDGRTSYFYTNEFPITAVTSLHDDTDYPHTYGSGYLVSSDDYVWYADGCIELVTGNFNAGLKNIKIIYMAGPATIPKDLERLATEWSILVFKGKDKLGISSQSAPDGSLTMFDRFLTPDLMAILNTYTDRSRHLCT